MNLKRERREIQRVQVKLDKAKEIVKYYEEILFCLKAYEAKLIEGKDG